MANSQHMALARQGTLMIARWREQHPGEQLDFSGASLTSHNLNRADLSEADLTGADLVGARFNQADLHNAIMRDAVPMMGQFNGANLREADLTNAILRRAEMSGADLTEANLTGATLINANLSGANLEGAILVGANLSDANLDGANLSKADLNGANMNSANLSGVNLRGANLGKVAFYRTALEGAVFRAAVLFRTVFGDCDLSKAVDLERASHAGPSAVGLDTISRSAGRVPEDFLRGVGAPEELLDYQRSVAAASRQYYTCFISFATKDESFTTKLYADLQARGVRCWHFPADVRGGYWIPEESSLDDLGLWINDDVDRGIRYYDKLVVVCSGESLDSEQLREEISRGMQKQDATGRRVFFPVAISEAPYDRRNRNVRNLQLGQYQLFDFRGLEDQQVYDAALDNLVQHLNQDQEASEGMAGAE